MRIKETNHIYSIPNTAKILYDNIFQINEVSTVNRVLISMTALFILVLMLLLCEEINPGTMFGSFTYGVLMSYPTKYNEQYYRKILIKYLMKGSNK